LIVIVTVTAIFIDIVYCIVIDFVVILVGYYYFLLDVGGNTVTRT
jgi:hypothetical protein